MENNVIFIGNLRTDKHKPQLAKSIFILFNHCLNFKYIKYEDIEVKGKSKKCKHVLITLRSEDDYNEAYHKLGTFESRKQLRFNFLELVDLSKHLRVNRDRQPDIWIPRPVVSVEENKNSPQNIKNTQPVVCVDERQNSRPKIRNQQSAVPVDLQPKEQDNESVKQRQKFYRERELLGNETRNKEFKLGGGEHFVTENLKSIVPKYMSGFLNSSQQGTLFIGVKDDG